MDFTRPNDKDKSGAIDEAEAKAAGVEFKDTDKSGGMTADEFLSSPSVELFSSDLKAAFGYLSRAGISVYQFDSSKLNTVTLTQATKVFGVDLPAGTQIFLQEDDLSSGEHVSAQLPEGTSVSIGGQDCAGEISYYGASQYNPAYVTLATLPHDQTFGVLPLPEGAEVAFEFDGEGAQLRAFSLKPGIFMGCNFNSESGWQGIRSEDAPTMSYGGITYHGEFRATYTHAGIQMSVNGRQVSPDGILIFDSASKLLSMTLTSPEDFRAMQELGFDVGSADKNNLSVLVKDGRVVLVEQTEHMRWR